MRSVNSRFSSLCVLDRRVPENGALDRRVLSGRVGVFALAAFSAGLIATLPGLSASAQEISAASTVAATGPVVTILQPQYADQLSGTVQVLVGLQARRFAAQTIEMFVDGKTATDGPIKIEALPSTNFHWDTRLFTDGPHKLSVVVTDKQGFRGTSEVVVYINNARKQDLSPPALKWINVKEGATWRGVVNVNLKVVDDFGVKWLFVLLNPASNPLKKPAQSSWGLNRPPYNVSLDTRKLADGQYVLRALAYDALENEGVAPSLTINIGNRSINPTYPQLEADGQSTLPSAPNPKNPANPGNAGPEILVTPPTAEVKTPGESVVTPPVVSPAQPVKAPDATIATPPTSTPPTSTHTNSVRPTSPALSVTTPSIVAPPSPSTNRSGNRNSRPNSGQTHLPQATHRTRPNHRAGATGEQNDGRRTAPSTDVESSEAPDRSFNADRLTPVDGARRTVKSAPQIGFATAQRPDGSVAPTQNGGETAPANHDGKPSMPPALDGRLVMTDRRQRNSLPPSLSTSGGGSNGSSRIVGAQADHATVAPSTSGRVVLPMSPSRLPLIGTPNMSNVWTDPATSQGSVVAPSTSPLFPNPNLNAVPTAPAQAPTLFAAVPQIAPLPRSARAAITVMPAAAAIPASFVVRKAQTLASVARQYQLPVQLLAAANHLPVGAKLPAGRKVLLPQPLLVSYKGEAVKGDVAAMMIGQTGVTPFRFLFEKQGGTLKWDGKHQRVTARNATHQVTLSIGSRSADVNNKEVMMDLAAFLVSGRTMVPLRFFEQALQARVEWEPATGRLFVAMAQ